MNTCERSRYDSSVSEAVILTKNTEAECRRKQLFYMPTENAVLSMRSKQVSHQQRSKNQTKLQKNDRRESVDTHLEVFQVEVGASDTRE